MTAQPEASTRTHGSPSDGPLVGVKVVDFTTFLSGPFCTEILADLGADVVKVESLDGDPSRHIPPHFIGADSAYYLSVNRGKRSLSVNLKADAGLKIVRQLIQQSDVVVENWRPGVSTRLGLDRMELQRVRPGLVWASISGFGEYSQRRAQPAYDMIVQALSGVMSITGESGGSPVRVGVPIGDIVAGLYATIGVLASLSESRSESASRAVDVSMLDSQLAMLSYQAAYTLVSGRAPGPQGSGHDSIPTYRSFRASDGRDFVLTANTERMWRATCQVLGMEWLTRDPRFADNSRRLANEEALWMLLEPAIQRNTASHWVEALNARGVPAALIKTVAEALDEAKDAGREMVVTLHSADAGTSVSVVGNPVKLSGRDHDSAAGYPPTLGQHTREILTLDLEYGPEDVSRLINEGVLR